jgi:EAL domain-containing protein (putative c-di-GMP-specific phosphodiesterase class I)
MSERKLRFYNVWILLLFALLGLALGGAISLLVLSLKNLGDPVALAALSFLDYLLSLVLVAFLVALFSLRKRFLDELASLSEMFGSPRFVYTRANLEGKLASLKARGRLEGVVVALNPRDLYGDLRQMYGSEAVRSINRIIMAELLHVFADRDDCLVAFSPLDGFFVYENTLDNRAFYSEMSSVSEAIKKNLRADGALPALKILMGSYVLMPTDEPSYALSMALLAENFHSSGRLTDEVVEYHDDMVERSNLLQDLSKDIERGLAKEEFRIFYQPKYLLKKKCFYGAEALIRWEHPEKGLLPPGLFIPYAENSGRIVDIDRYVFKHVCADLAEWKSKKTPLLVISVNLSRKTVYAPGILEYFKQTIAQYGVDPSYLEIELTESIAARDSIYIADLIKKLRELGFRTAIDDFGVGYSSFSSLKKIPFDTLKIDKAFVDDLEVSEEARSMVRFVIALGHSLGMDVIAEGVQSAPQVEILKALKLDSIQGYYFAHPMSVYDYIRFLSVHPVLKKKKEGKA